jgi:hypothetical protein
MQDIILTVLYILLYGSFAILFTAPFIFIASWGFIINRSKTPQDYTPRTNGDQF